ncbi:MAG: SMP-30/gluconolactonase/LRE family protein [Bythopirellula sp.]
MKRASMPLQLTPDNCRLFGEGLDHPECVAIGPDGTIYAGGEAGQIYRIDTDGTFREIGSTGGFILGIAVDGQGSIHCCDCGQAAVYRVDSDGAVHQRSVGAQDRPFRVPNYGVFDPEGNLFVSDSGDYWHRPGTGYLLKIAPNDSTSVFHRGPFLFANGLAIDPSGQWLYVVQSTAPNVVRVPLDQPDGPLEVTHTLPSGTVPDGLAFAADGRLVIACYKPDAVFVGATDGSIELLCDDPTGELLSRPTNVAIGQGVLYLANIGGWHLTVIETDLTPAPLYYPHVRKR